MVVLVPEHSATLGELARLTYAARLGSLSVKFERDKNQLQERTFPRPADPAMSS